MSLESGPRALSPVEQQSTASMVAESIREAIASGSIAPGSQLGEVDYAAQLGVSRGPLREGLQRLTQEGLLVAHRNRGLFVMEMSPENVSDIYLAREAVERAAARRIHDNDPGHARDELGLVIDVMAAAKARGDVRSVSRADSTFHRLLVELAQSPRLSRIHRTLLTETRMCIHAMEHTYEFDEQRVAEHREIAVSFGSGNPDLTDRLLVAHMRDALDRLST